ncbi:MAG: SH3 domain-containing protein [Anaerolineae bacterium]|nr:SH3 domain-containing protein [Anaerolineae bacterium]
MARMTKWTLLVTLVLGLLPGGLVSGQGGAVIGPNLLRNPGFEGVYYSYGTVLEFRVADEWHPWYRAQGEDELYWRYRRPEYRPATYVYEGDGAQQFFASYGTHQAGLSQQVYGVTPGATYRFSLVAYLWSSMEDDPYTSIDPAGFFVRVGIDPTGGIDAFADSVIWSPFETFYDQWQALSVEVEAQADTVTVFFWSEQDAPVVHNDVAVDAASLVQVEPSGSTLSAAPPPPLSPTGLTVATPAGEAVGTFTPTINLRLRATPAGDVLTVVPFGVAAVLYGRSPDDNWVLIGYAGTTGWVASWLGDYSLPFESVPVIVP